MQHRSPRRKATAALIALLTVLGVFTADTTPANATQPAAVVAAYPPVRPAAVDLESPPRIGRVNLLVVHTAESPETAQADQNICGYLARTPNASVHACVDADSITPSVPENRTAWTASHRFVNNQAKQAELAGYAGQTAAEWADAYSIAELHNAAQLFARWALEDSIPIVKLSTAEMCAGKRGFIGHVDVRGPCAANSDGHWDPGPNFPWAFFLDLVRFYAGQPVTPTAPVLASPAQVKALLESWGFPCTDAEHAGNFWCVAAFQAKFKIAVDGVWGEETQATAQAWLAFLNAIPKPQTPEQAALSFVASCTTSSYTVPSSSPCVKLGQALLVKSGYAIAQSGDYGYETAGAVATFQRDNSLPVDAVLSPAVWSALVT